MLGYSQYKHKIHNNNKKSERNTNKTLLPSLFIYIFFSLFLFQIFFFFFNIRPFFFPYYILFFLSRCTLFFVNIVPCVLRFNTHIIPAHIWGNTTSSFLKFSFFYESPWVYVWESRRPAWWNRAASQSVVCCQRKNNSNRVLQCCFLWFLDFCFLSFCLCSFF